MKFELTLIIDESITNTDWIATFIFNTYEEACNYGKLMVESGYEIKIGEYIEY